MRCAPGARRQHVPGDESVSTARETHQVLLLLTTPSRKSSFAPNVSFTVFTGDAVDGAVWDDGRDVSEETIRLCSV